MDDLVDRMPSVLMDKMLFLLDGINPYATVSRACAELYRLPLADVTFMDPQKVVEQADAFPQNDGCPDIFSNNIYRFV